MDVRLGDHRRDEIALSVSERRRGWPAKMTSMASLDIRPPESWDMTEEQLRAWWGAVVDDLSAALDAKGS